MRGMQTKERRRRSRTMQQLQWARVMRERRLPWRSIAVAAERWEDAVEWPLQQRKELRSVSAACF